MGGGKTLTLPADTWRSGQGDTGCAGSLQAPKERCVRHWLPGPAVPCLRGTPFDPRARSLDREASSEGQRALTTGSMNCKKIYCNALMNGYFTHPYFWVVPMVKLSNAEMNHIIDLLRCICGWIYISVVVDNILFYFNRMAMLVDFLAAATKLTGN